jgi:hypothetical protein
VLRRPSPYPKASLEQSAFLLDLLFIKPARGCPCSIGHARDTVAQNPPRQACWASSVSTRKPPVAACWLGGRDRTASSLGSPTAIVSALGGAFQCAVEVRELILAWRMELEHQFRHIRSGQIPIPVS